MIFRLLTKMDFEAKVIVLVENGDEEAMIGWLDIGCDGREERRLKF